MIRSVAVLSAALLLGGCGLLPGTQPRPEPPARIDGLTDVASVAAGAAHSLALKGDGSVWAWGSNYFGQLGLGEIRSTHTPMRIDGLPPAAAVAAGANHSLALGRDGTVWAWGSNSSGELGGPSQAGNQSRKPQRVEGVSEAIAVAAGGENSYTVRRDGSVLAWGYAGQGQLGRGIEKLSQTPVDVPGLRGVRSAAAGWYVGLAVTADGTLWSWGLDAVDGERGVTAAPRRRLSSVAAAAGGGRSGGNETSTPPHVVVARTDGSVWAWGRNDVGQVGNGSTSALVSPTRVEGIDAAQAVAAGWTHSLALDQDGHIWAWGHNGLGQLGTPPSSKDELSAVPRQVPGVSGIVAIASGADHNLAVTRDGEVWAWGDNGDGQLGR